MADERLLAFEGAQGFGAYTTGGRGGDVVKVTNLDNSGKGSLRWALEQLDGPRIVVFEVGGLIQLKEQIEVNGDVTIAGQTAPGGITIGGARLRLMEDNVIIRGLHIRTGEDSWGDSDYDARDGISVGRSDKPVRNIVIDSNSITWSVDENISLWGDVENVTISNNIIGEALNDSKHPEGDHSMGLLVGDGASEISIYGNLFAHNKFRNPQIMDGSHEIEFINNVVYNYGNSGFSALGDSSAHVINNVFIKGPDSTDRAPILFHKSKSGAEYYVSGNKGSITGEGTKYIEDSHVFRAATKDILPTKDVEDYVLKNVGANADDRDYHDERIIDTVLDGRGKVINDHDDVGGYKDSGGGRKLTDSDGDGIPDVYEEIIGSDAKRSDAGREGEGGYDNIEVYINGLISGFSKSAPEVSDEDTNDGPSQEEEPVVEEAPEKEEETVTLSGKEIEAEDLTITSGFTEKDLAPASDGKILQGSMNEVSEAKMIFSGAAGTYDLSLEYFDETDGESQMSVSVNNKEVASWTWDQKLGSHLANHLSLTSKVIEGLELQPGDEVKLSGRADGKEPLRVDKLVFDSKSLSDAGPAASGDSFRVEAEKFVLTGFAALSLSVAKNGKIIARTGDEAHRADYDFEGASGTYDILIDYFDESDGESELKVAVNGQVVDDWVWDDHTESHIATKDNAMTRVIENVRINKGDEISLIGHDDGKEPLRIDAVEFVHQDLGFV